MSFISIVVPAYNESGNIEKLVKEVSEKLKDEIFEIIIVNDGSTDNSLEIIKSISKKNKRVKYLSFSRNFGHQAALRAGLKMAKGEAAISMDADLQHPPSLLPEIISMWRDGGYEVVFTVRKDTSETSLAKRVTSAIFYKVLNILSGLQMKEGAADFRLLDRKVLDIINSQVESDIFLRGYISWIGFKQIGIPYVPAKRFSGTSNYSLKKMLSLAGTGVTQFSIKPLRLAFGLAMIALIASFSYVIYAFIIALSGGAVSGWFSLVTLFVFLQGIQFLLLGLVGEYLGRTFMQTKYRPDYIISEGSVDDEK